MVASKSFPVLLDRLKSRFEENPNRKLWLVGIVFCRPQLKLAREQIIPSLSYFHRESGRNIDFFFAGFDGELVPNPEHVSIKTGISSKPEWYFDPDEFDRFADEIRIKTNSRYRYKGGCDLLLLNCNYSPIGEPLLDFESSALAQLEVLRNQGRLPDASHFFKNIFDYCKAVNTNDPAWGFGVDADTGSSLVELCEKFLRQSNEIQTLAAVKTTAEKNTNDINLRSSQNQSELNKGPFRYDLATRNLILMSSRTRLEVDTRYAEVLDIMLGKEHKPFSARRSHLDYPIIATVFELGRLKEENPNWDEKRLQLELRRRMAAQDANHKKMAQEFRRQFSKWLRNNGIDPDRVITADRKHNAYKLGNGFNTLRAATGDSEAGLQAVGPKIENYGEETEETYGKPKAKHFRSDDEDYDPQEY